jgi:hypothetical protein
MMKLNGGPFVRRKFTFIFAASMVTTWSATAAPDEKSITLTMSNSAKVPIQILVRDLISGKTDEQNAVVAPGKSTSSKAKLDAKGIVDFFVNVRFVDEKKGSYYRCLAFRAPVGDKGLRYNVNESFGKSVGGSGVGCRP